MYTEFLNEKAEVADLTELQLGKKKVYNFILYILRGRPLLSGISERISSA